MVMLFEWGKSICSNCSFEGNLIPEFTVSFSDNQNMIVTNSKFDLAHSGKFYDGNPLSEATHN